MIELSSIILIILGYFKTKEKSAYEMVKELDISNSHYTWETFFCSNTICYTSITYINIYNTII